MKKYILFLLILSFILTIGLFSLNPTLAQTVQQDTQAIIQKLQQQIKALQEQVAKLQAEVSSTKTELEVVKTELKFTKALRLGTTGNEVKQLQEFLKQFPDIYPQGLVTGYFGPLTEAAIRKFQEKNDIESIGVVGPKTLSKLNKLVTEGAGASGVVPPGLLIAPGIQKKIGISGTTTPIATPTTPVITSPITPTPVQPVATVPTGICLLKDKYTNIPRFDIADFGLGFAKYAVTGINTVAGLQTACTQTIYNYLLQNYCKTNTNPVQQLVMTYDYRGIGDYSGLSCSALGCNFIDCSSVVALAPIPNPTPVATTTPTPTPTSTPTPVPVPTTTATTTPTTTATTEPIISNVHAENITSSGTQIKWTTDELADSAAEFGTSSSGPFNFSAVTCSSSTGNVTDHCISFTGLSPSTTYYYNVRSIDSANNVRWSNFFQFTSISSTTATATPTTTTNTAPPVPSTPTGPTSGSTSFYHLFSINIYPDPDGDQVKAIFDWGDGTVLESGFYTLPMGGTQVSLSHSWTAAGTYIVKAKTRDSIGLESAWSNGSSITISAGTSNYYPPTIPTGLSATAISSSQINLSWNASTDPYNTNGSVTGYNIYRNGSFIVSTALTSYNDTGLIAATSYRYNIAAYNAVGLSSSQSGSVSVTTLSSSVTATSTSYLNSRTKNLAAISQMLNSLNQILEKLSQLFK